MRAVSFVVLGTLLATAFAGCLDQTESNSSEANRLLRQGPGAKQTLRISPDWAELALVDERPPLHDHKNPAHHQNLTTPNFDIVGWDPLITDYYGRTAGDHACGDTKEKDGRRLSITHSFGTDVAFVIVDTTDPTEPKKIGELVMSFTQVYDLALSPDLNWIVLATSPMDAGPGPEGGPVPPPLKANYEEGDIMWRDACSGQEWPVPIMGPEAGLPFASGNVLVDISNPRAPNVADFMFYPPLGSHSITITDMDGRMIAMSSVPNVPDQASFYAIMEITRAPTGTGKLMPLSIYQHPASQTGPVATTEGMHDGLIAKHPISGKWIGYLAHGALGLVMIDLTNPASPVYLGEWADFAGAVGEFAPDSPYVHEALPAPDVWEGRHYTWIGEECIGHPTNTPTCLVFGLDTTDPTKPEFVGAWTLPIDVQWSQGLEWSLHYLALMNRTLFVTAYHGGVWAVDVSTPEARATMPSIGVFIPANVSPKKFDTPPRGLIVQALYGGYALDNTPTILDLNVASDNTLIIFDMHSGIYSVRFNDQVQAPPPEPWPLTAGPTQ